MALTIPIQLITATRRADSSVSIKSDSQIEISSEDFGKLDSLRGNTGVLIVGDTVALSLDDKEVKEMIESMPKYDATEIKSPSKRYKAILYRVLEKKLNRKPLEEEFNKYYIERYEKLCSDGLDFLNGEL